MGRPRIDGRPGQKKAKDPNKPKRSTSAYFYFLASCREQAKKQGRSISKIAEFTKECSVKWREMGTKEKEIFEGKAATDKARYDREMSIYNGGTGKVKDPNQPKKPLTGYFLFLADFREENRGKDIHNKDLLKMAGERWREMDDSEKLPYEQKSQGEQKKYEQAMASYRRGKANGGNVAAAAPIDDDEDEEDDDDDEDEDDE